MIDENGNPMIVDFGKAQLLHCDDEDLTSSMEGTYTFLSPECCSFDTSTYSMKKADVWALGITLYILTFNQFPFDLGQTEIDVMENISNCHLSFEGRRISTELHQMLSMMLEKDPSKRATASQLLKCKFLNPDLQKAYHPMHWERDDVDTTMSYLMKQPRFQLFSC